MWPLLQQSVGSALLLCLASSTLWGGTGLIEVPSSDCLPGGALRALASDVAERGMSVLGVDLGISDDFELGAARWRLDGGRRKGTAVNLKMRLLHRRGLPSLSVGARDARAEVLSKPEGYIVLGWKFGRRASACLGAIGGPEGTKFMGGLSYRLSLSTSILFDFRGGDVNLGTEFEVPLLGLFSKWAVLDAFGRKDLAVWVGWRL